MGRFEHESSSLSLPAGPAPSARRGPVPAGARARRPAARERRPAPRGAAVGACFVTVEPAGRRLRVLAGETLHHTLLRAGLVASSPCGGQGMCGKCRVVVAPPHAVAATDHADLAAADLARGVRLACRVRPTVDLKIRLEPELEPGEMQIETAGAGPAELEPLDGSTGRRAGELASPVVQVEPVVGTGRFAAHFAGSPRAVELAGWRRELRPRGLAIDLGTTTLVVSLVSLTDGVELATAAAPNPQAAFGPDVITRIACAAEPGGLERLADAVRQALDGLVDEVCVEVGARRGEILAAVVGGNPAMLELAAAIDPSPLGQAPFEVTIASGCSVAPDCFGLRLHPAAQLYVPPVLHGFVGSDVSAGLTSLADFFDGGRSRLFIDVGTNGELVLQADGRCLATSAAAGPAFEGMGLSCGMRAELGAVDGVGIAADGSLELHTVGDEPPVGLCGSGVIDLVAVLLELGLIEPTGRLLRPGASLRRPSPVARGLVERDGMAAFELVDGVWLTQKDVREIQLAKSAIRTAVDMLLEHAGDPKLDQIVVAGGFGTSLRAASLERLGMLPAGSAGAVEFAGNTSAAGCVRLLGDAALRGRLERRVRDIEHVALAEHPDFMDRYVTNMEFASSPDAAA